MNRVLATGCLVLAILGGCAPKAAETAGGASLANPRTLTNDAENSAPRTPATTPLLHGNDPVAFVNGKPITAEQLYRPAIEAYGLNFVLYLAQIELCRQKAEAAKVQVTPQDIATERQRTLEQMFVEAVPDDGKMSPDELKAFRKKEYERLLTQFLQVRHLSLQEFDLAATINAYLRKLAEPGLMDQIKEEHLQEGFKIMFGEKVRVRHIQLARLQEVPEAQRRLAAGESFATVAREMTTDEKTRAQGGELRPFSRAEPMWPDAFKDAAFALKDPGDVSGPVSTGDAVHLIQLVARIPPNPAVKYEANREFVRQKIYDGLLQVRIGQLREQLRQEAPRALKIEEPALRKQYAQRLERASGETTRDPNQVRREIELDGRRSAATRPAADSTASPATLPEGLRPPATRPAH